MAEILKKTRVVRYYKNDLDAQNEIVPGTEDRDIWIDVEVWDTITTEHGSGVDFTRRFWSFNWDSAARTTKYIKIYDPNDKSTYVPVPIPGQIIVESGSGVDYKKQTWVFDNTDTNDNRTTHVDRVYHAEFSGEDSSVDKDQYVDFEVGETFTVEHGSGVDFVREIWSFDNSQIPLASDLPPERYRVNEEIWPASRERIDRESAYTETTVGSEPS